MHLKCKCSINTVNHLNIFSPFYFKFFKTMYVLSKYICFQIQQFSVQCNMFIVLENIINNKNFVNASLKNVNFSLQFFFHFAKWDTVQIVLCVCRPVILIIVVHYMFSVSSILHQVLVGRAAVVKKVALKIRKNAFFSVLICEGELKVKCACNFLSLIINNGIQNKGII